MFLCSISLTADEEDQGNIPDLINDDVEEGVDSDEEIVGRKKRRRSESYS